MAERSLVKNAADPEQVEAAAEKEADVRNVELNDLRSILATNGGRRFILRVISEVCGYGRTGWSMDSRVSDYNLARSDLGLELLAEVNLADRDAWPLALREARLSEGKK